MSDTKMILSNVNVSNIVYHVGVKQKLFSGLRYRSGSVSQAFNVANAVDYNVAAVHVLGKVKNRIIYTILIRQFLCGDNCTFPYKKSSYYLA